MMKWRQRLHTRDTACALWVALCFGVTSAVYLSWLDRLVTLTSGTAADWLSMVAGYLMQAAGMGAAMEMMRRNPDGDHTHVLTASAALFAAVTAPALLSGSAAAVAGFGLVMNLFCGVIAGLYLYAIATNADPSRRGMVFGGGYAISTVVVGLAALIGRGALLHSRHALILYLPLCALIAWSAARLGLLKPPEASAEEAVPDEPGIPLALACAVIALISAVKNLGFSFPSADIEAGLIPELSRLPYALGLAAAGIINDRNRRLGMACTVAALILPFIMLGLNGEPVPGAICWGLDYLFFGFFSVFRVVLLADLAAAHNKPMLAGLGLLFGRVGDALGTICSVTLAKVPLVLITVVSVLFACTIVLFFALYQRLFVVVAEPVPTEREIFERFAARHDLSQREREVLRLVLDEHTNSEIAGELFVSEATVKYHVRNLLRKTGCKSRLEILALYGGGNSDTIS